MSFTLHGLGVSGGIAIGQAQLLSHATLEVAHLTLPARQVEKEVLRFETAVERVRAELDELRNEMAESAAEMRAFIDVHSLILQDPELVDVPKTLIRERGCNAEWALVQQMDYLVKQFDAIDDPYLRERKADVVQVVERVIKELMGRAGKIGKSSKAAKGVKEEEQIIVAHDLPPSDLISFKEHRFAAFVTDVGGATSHTAILARSMAIPAVVGLRGAREVIRDGELLIVDGFRGVIIINPDERVLEEYRLRKTQIELERSKLKRLKKADPLTLDDVRVDLMANIELPDDVQAVKDNGADGVGLFRTEFLFLNRREIPSEDEQFEAYRKVVKGMAGKPVVIRTYDLGADKALDQARSAINPALGLRGIRLSLSEPAMFGVQLRAILRAARFGPVRILIPMISNAHEVDATRAAIDRAREDLRDRRVAYGEDIQLGGMIEIPAAALALNMFLKRLDFMSIGTNDLTQYTLAIDRGDEEVAGLYDSLHPAVLMLIAHVLAGGEKAGVPVSICGELAGNPKLTRLLLGMGLRHFSMHPSQILEVKQQVLTSDVGQLAPMVRKLLRLDDSAQIREQIRRLNLPADHSAH
ncbi:phosphoenolpyruvate--protein phosphotransferase [Fluviibacter phosphoraccumulans]|uniref:phosphoenolpyruvate--protein phosphotransferase n=1 Tax=Fluviibacter phosphoraccumulans TaxID=1751046 RepID=UPI0010B47554|nr:phosphoenolpyruvate--protein phosphotransferase [Fluviibacter phosphoraccumulans]BCA66488.1 phosphoenolpyruvate-protein phosphotransferase [Fluviibacter phosphoraccumulans]